MPNSPRRRKRSKRPRQTKMILTNCAACAAPLAHNLGKRCSRCKTRYCNEASDGRRAEATCKRFRALHAPVEKARKSCLRAYLRRPRRHWQAAGRGHPGFGRPGTPERQRRLDERTTVPKPANPRQQVAGARDAWMAHLAGRGLPPDWTYRDLEGHR